MEQKQELRKHCKAKRNAILPQERQKKSRIICKRLLESAAYEKAQKILVYSAIKSEVDLHDLCEQALREKKELYFPKVTGETMEFYRICDFGQLKEGSFSVLEPDTGHHALTVFSGEAGTWILVPGVAFDKHGMRMGYGGGFYDRYLKKHPGLHKTGIAFEEQIVLQIPAEAFDRPMDDVITEQQWYGITGGE